MSFNSDVSFSKVMKFDSDLTIEQLCLQLESKTFKWLTKDDFVAAVAALNGTRESGMRFVDKSIKAGLKQADRKYHVIRSLAKCRMCTMDENEKEEEEKKEESKEAGPTVHYFS